MTLVLQVRECVQGAMYSANRASEWQGQASDMESGSSGLACNLDPHNLSLHRGHEPAEWCACVHMCTAPGRFSTTVLVGIPGW